MTGKLDLVKKYFHLLETFSTDQAAFAELLHPEFQQKELPNLLNKKGQASDFAHTLERAGLGAKILKRQSFRVTHHVETEQQIVVEADWEGEMAIAAGPLQAGQVMKAFFCIVCEFRDGKIHRQRNYDCFEAF